MKKKIIDLFSGAGGLTEGFRSDEFEIINHIEKDYAASKTLMLRDIFYYLKHTNNLKYYISFLSGELSFEDLAGYVPPHLFEKTINMEISDDNLNIIFGKIGDVEDVFGIIGGPPCQAYSTIGRAQNKSKKNNDVRIYLYRYYIQFLKKYNPRFFVFENVKGLLSFKDSDGELLFPKMQEEFRSIGYELDYKLLNMKDYGVPQSRERIIIFGVPKNDSTLIKDFFDNLEELKEKPMTIRDVFEDMPKLSSGQEKNSYSRLCSSTIKKYYRSISGIPLTQNISRPNSTRDLEIYKEVAEAKQLGYNLKYNELKESLKTHKHEDKFLDRFKALSWDGPSHTIVAHISKDGHHYIHPDVKQNRSITVREAARIQGFPDDYYFETSRTQAFIQIGNAVPPILSLKISEVIDKMQWK